MRYRLMLAIAFLSTLVMVTAQEVDLDKLLDEQLKKKAEKKSELTEATFKNSRIINGHSIENTQKGIMDFRISHRFGTLNKGPYELFGLDNASMRMGLDFGLTDRLMVGFGRSTFQKQYDAFFKYRIIRQQAGKKNVPLSVSFAGTAMLKTLKNTDTLKRYFSDRMFYAGQLIIARKFSNAFSLQLMPTMVHYNLVQKATDPNDLFSVGVGGRLKLTQRVSLNAEYYYQIDKQPGTYNSLSIGFDIETGGHVFQLHFTNSTGMTERTFITETTGRWEKGDINFGFNISRIFELNKKKRKNS